MSQGSCNIKSQKYISCLSNPKWIKTKLSFSERFLFQAQKSGKIRPKKKRILIRTLNNRLIIAEENLSQQLTEHLQLSEPNSTSTLTHSISDFENAFSLLSLKDDIAR
ncbi:hypothetical protein F8M41_021348 [Gigaspora margarita]|uniref:Uncharacterized protein n=1 Tax=Gigaspora margarita TaxID=4874 RepID=A0A8H4ETW3_GIGMA|nr:hypothetical protein F8M41_021348 [Gigaspora margarita]